MDIKDIFVLDHTCLERKRDKFDVIGKDFRIDNRENSDGKINIIDFPNPYNKLDKSLKNDVKTGINYEDYHNFFNPNVDYFSFGMWFYEDLRLAKTNFNGNALMQLVFLPSILVYLDCNYRYFTLYISNPSQWNISGDTTKKVYTIRNDWNHLAIIKNKRDITIFLNGNPVYKLKTYSDIYHSSVFKRELSFGKSTKDNYNIMIPYNNIVYVRNKTLYNVNEPFDYKNNMFDTLASGIGYNTLLSTNGVKYCIKDNDIINLGGELSTKDYSDYDMQNINFESEYTDFEIVKPKTEETRYIEKIKDENISNIIIDNQVNVFYEDFNNGNVNNPHFIGNSGLISEKAGRWCFDRNTAGTGYILFKDFNAMNFKENDFTIAFRLYTEKNEFHTPLLSAYGKDGIFGFFAYTYKGKTYPNLHQPMPYKNTWHREDTNPFGCSNGYKPPAFPDDLTGYGFETNKWNDFVITREKGDKYKYYMNGKLVLTFNGMQYRYDGDFVSIGIGILNGSTDYANRYWMTDIFIMTGKAVNEEEALSYNFNKYLYNNAFYIEKQNKYYIPSIPTEGYSLDFSKDIPENLIGPLGNNSIDTLDGEKYLNIKSSDKVDLLNSKMFDFRDKDFSLYFRINLKTRRNIYLFHDNKGGYVFCLNINGINEGNIGYATGNSHQWYIDFLNTTLVVENKRLNLNTWYDIHLIRHKNVYKLYINNELVNSYIFNYQGEMFSNKIQRYNFYSSFVINYNTSNEPSFLLSKLVIIKNKALDLDILKNTDFPQGEFTVLGYNKLQISDKKVSKILKLNFSNSIYNKSLGELFNMEIVNKEGKKSLMKKGSDSWFKIYPNNLFDLKNNDFTLTTNIYIEDPGNNPSNSPLFGEHNEGFLSADVFRFSTEKDKNRFTTYIGNYNRSWAMTGDSESYPGYSKTPYNFNAWNRLTITMENGVFKQYVNGVFDISYNKFTNHSSLKYNRNNPFYIGRWGDNNVNGNAKIWFSDFSIINGIAISDQNILDDLINNDEIPNGYNYIYLDKEESKVKLYDNKVELTSDDIEDLKSINDHLYNNNGENIWLSDHDRFNITKAMMNSLNNEFDIVFPNKISNDIIHKPNVKLLYKTPINLINKYSELSINIFKGENVERNIPDFKISGIVEKNNNIYYQISKDDQNYLGYDRSNGVWSKDIKMTKRELEAITSNEYGKLFGTKLYESDLYVKIYIQNKLYTNKPAIINGIEVKYTPNQGPIIESPIITPDEIHYEFCRVSCTVRDFENHKIYARVLIKKSNEYYPEETYDYEVADDWSLVKNGGEFMRAYNEKYFLPGLNKIKIEVKDEYGFMDEWVGNLTITNKGPLMNYTHNDFGLSAQLSDPESDKVSVQISIDDKIILPFGDLIKTPTTFNYEWSIDHLVFGKKHKVKFEVRDYFKKITTEEFDITGKYKSLLFKDDKGRYFTTDRAEILRYLDLKTIIAGQNSDIYSVTLQNQTNYNLKNVTINIDSHNLPDNAKLLLSETPDPFVGVEDISIDGVMKDGDTKPFYVQIQSSPGRGELNGRFEISAKGNIAE